MIKVVCDLCGKEIQNEKKRRKYKIKERRAWLNAQNNAWITEWVYIDTHDECVMTILQAAKNKQ